MLATVSEDMRSGNKSKYSGDLSKQYSLVEQIIVNEMNEQNELKESKKEDAAEFEKLLEETEAKVLRKKEYGKRKDVDGNLTDYSEGKRRAGNPTDEAIAVIADAIKASIASKVDEGKVEKDIMTWIQMTNRGIADLLFASDIPMTNKFYADAYDLIESVGLKTVVSIFCSRGKAFARDSFQQSMKEMDCKPVVFHKLYVGLSDWRQQADDFMGGQSFVSPPIVIDPLLQSSSSNNESSDDQDMVLL